MTTTTITTTPTITTITTIMAAATRRCTPHPAHTDRPHQAYTIRVRTRPSLISRAFARPHPGAALLDRGRGARAGITPDRRALGQAMARLCTGDRVRFWLAALPWRSFCARTFTTALAIVLLLATLGQSQAADPEPKRVLMLQSFGLRFKPWTDYSEILRSEMRRQSKAPIDFLDQTLLTARLDDDRR